MMNIYVKALLVGFGVLILAFLAIVLFRNDIARFAAKSELEANGIVLQGLETLEIDLFEGKARLGPVTATLPGFGDTEARTMALQQVVIDLKPFELIDGVLRIESAEIVRPTASLTVTDTGDVALKQVAFADTKQVSELQGERAGEPWQLEVTELRVTDGQLTVDYGGKSYNLTVDASVPAFNWPAATNPSELTIGFQDGDRKLSAQMTIVDWSFAKPAEMAIAAHNLDLGVFTGGAVNGEVTAELAAKLVNSTEGWRLALNGQPSVAKGSFQSDLATIESDTLSVSFTDVILGLSEDKAGLIDGGIGVALSGLTVKRTGPEPIVTTAESAALAIESANVSTVDMAGKNSLSASVELNGVQTDLQRGLVIKSPYLTAKQLSITDGKPVLKETTIKSASLLLNGNEFLRGEKVILPDLQLQAGQTLVSSAVIEQFKAVHDEEPFITASGLRVTDMAIDANQLGIGIISIVEPTATFLRLPEGTLRIQPTLQMLDTVFLSDANGSPGQAASSVTTAPFVLQVGKIESEGLGKFRLTDKSLANPATIQFDLDSFQLGPLSSAAPEQPAAYRLDGHVGEFAKLESAGSVYLFDNANDTFQTATSFQNFELPSLGSYTEEILGLGVERGQFSLKLDLAATKGVLNGQADMTLRDLKVQNVKASDGKTLGERLDMPVKTAISLLRKKDGDIELNIPISGNLDAPDFDTRSAVNLAISNAINKATIGTLKTAFDGLTLPVQGFVRLIGGSKKVRLPDIQFEPNSVAPIGESTQILERTAGLLERKERVSIQLCGAVSVDDLSAIRSEAYQAALEQYQQAVSPNEGDQTNDSEQPEPAIPFQKPITDAVDPTEAAKLTELMSTRARGVKRQMIDTHGIAVERLLECTPTLEGLATQQEKPKKAIPPIVELRWIS